MKFKNNIWNWIGFGVGIMIFIAGIIFLLTPPDSYYTNSVDKSSFGADYYTYQYEATRIVASNAAVAANNIRELGVALSRYAGFFFMAMGMLTIIHYGKSCFVSSHSTAPSDETPKNQCVICDDN